MLNDSDNKWSKFSTKQWYVINSQTAKEKYSQKNSVNIFLVKGAITVTAENGTDVAFKYCAPFCACNTKIDGFFIDKANHLYIANPM